MILIMVQKMANFLFFGVKTTKLLIFGVKAMKSFKDQNKFEIWERYISENFYILFLTNYNIKRPQNTSVCKNFSKYWKVTVNQLTFWYLNTFYWFSFWKRSLVYSTPKNCNLNTFNFTSTCLRFLLSMFLRMVSNYY